MWRDLIMERVTKSADACLTALSIMTSARMPKAVYIEDVIERVVQYTKFHLQNTLYPQYDPVYRVNPHGGQCSTLIQCPNVQYPFYSMLTSVFVLMRQGHKVLYNQTSCQLLCLYFCIPSNCVVPPTVKFIDKSPFPKNCLMLETLLIKTR